MTLMAMSNLLTLNRIAWKYLVDEDRCDEIGEFFL